jgi:hypothetical protein
VHKIDGPGNDSNQFTEGDPLLGVEATTVTAAWANAVQGELVSVIEAKGITLDKNNNEQLALALNVAGEIGFRNLIINPEFEFWQRGNLGATSDNSNLVHPDAAADPQSFSAMIASNPSTGGTPDRFVVNTDFNGGSGTLQMTRSEITAFQANFIWGTKALGARYQLEIRNGSAPADRAWGQRVEDVQLLSEKVLTFSVICRAGGNTTASTGQLRITQVFNPSGGGAGSANVVVGTKAVSVTQSYSRLEYSVSMPTTQGKTIDPGSYTFFEWVDDDGWAGDPLGGLDQTAWQVEIASAATTYARRPSPMEFALCLHYFCMSYKHDDSFPGNPDFIGQVAGEQSGSTITHNNHYRFPVQMRVIPSIIYYSPSLGTPNRIAWNTDKTVTANFNATKSALGQPAVASSQPADTNFLFQFSADAEL